MSRRSRLALVVLVLLAIAGVAYAASELTVEDRLCRLEALHDLADQSCTTALVIDQDTLIENETLTLRAGDSIEFRNGARLSIGSGASVDWQGTPTSTWSDDGTVQNLERDIDIFGSGDIMFMAGSEPSTIRFVEIDLQPIEEVDHYPLHWHLVGDGSRGTLVEGVVVKNSTNRAFVPHGSHGITFRDTIAKNTAGDPYWYNRGRDENAPNDLLYDHALADGVTIGANQGRDFRLSAFWLGAGTGKEIRDSVALNVNPTFDKDCSGFHWPEGNGGPGGWAFHNNASFGSDCFGIFWWQNSKELKLVDGFRGDAISQGAYISANHYQNFDVSGVKVLALGWTLADGHAGDVIAAHHNDIAAGKEVTFTNVTFDSFTVRNGGGQTAGRYVINTTNLTCGEIIWQDVYPGTKVIIDGQEC